MKTVLQKVCLKAAFQIQTSLCVCLSRSLSLCVFFRATLAGGLCTLSEVREGSSHIFHPLAVSDWESKLVGEKRGRDGELGVWMGAGTAEKSRCRDERKTRPRNREKKRP